MKLRTRLLLESFAARRCWLPRASCQHERRMEAHKFWGEFGDYDRLGRRFCRDREIGYLSYRLHLRDIAVQSATDLL